VFVEKHNSPGRERSDCFELIQSNLSGLEIVTFDELLEKVDELLQLLCW
jgi:hypothetical protein